MKDNMRKIIKGFRDVSEKYDCFLFDLWGVLYEGEAIFRDALEVLRKLHLLNKPVVLISNSPFLSPDCIEKLEQSGLPRELYQTVLTAGDLCFEYIQNEYKIAKKIYLIDTHYWAKWQKISNLHLVTDNIHEADVILALAVPHTVKDPKDIALHYDEIFKQAIKRNLKFICANPDLLAFCSKKQHLRPGLLSQRYQQLGGDLLSFGKPFPEIFIRALKQIKCPDRVLMTGDTEYTDIQGALRHNMDAMLITASYEVDSESKATYFSETLKW
jgi:HAD superfamily hydrolase (TIGR01459 family)